MPSAEPSRHEPEPFGDILKDLARQTQRARKTLKGRRLAQRIVTEALGAQAAHASVASVKAGVVVIETQSPAFFQELEGFHRERLLAALKAGGLKVAVLRVRLAET